MAAGDQKYVDDNDGLKKTGRWYNSHPIYSFANLELKNSEPSSSKKYYYNGLATNIIMNYVIYKTNKDFQKLLNEIFQKKARVENSVFFLKKNGVREDIHLERVDMIISELQKQSWMIIKMIHV